MISRKVGDIVEYSWRFIILYITWKHVVAGGGSLGNFYACFTAIRGVCTGARVRIGKEYPEWFARCELLPHSGRSRCLPATGYWQPALTIQAIPETKTFIQNLTPKFNSTFNPFMLRLPFLTASFVYSLHQSSSIILSPEFMPCYASK